MMWTTKRVMRKRSEAPPSTRRKRKRKMV